MVVFAGEDVWITVSYITHHAVNVQGTSDHQVNDLKIITAREYSPSTAR